STFRTYLQNFFQTLFGEFNVVFRQGLRFLDETVKQNHIAFIHGENDTRDTFIQRHAYFPQTLPNLADYRHPDWPPKLHSLDFGANGSLVCRVQFFQPFTNRFMPSVRPKKLYG